MQHRADKIALLAIALSGVGSWLLFDRLPDPFPIHFGWDGKADGFTSRQLGAWLLPLIALVVWLLSWLLPRISPRGYEMDAFAAAFRGLVCGVVVFLVALHLLLLWRTGQGHTSLGGGLSFLLGLLFLVVGHFLGRTEPNFFMGIRTPWTLTDARVWRQTHRLGGILIRGFGLLVVVSSVALDARTSLSLCLGGMGLLAAGLVAHSYWLYRRLNTA